MTTEIENGQKVISDGEKCSKEVAEILKKYNCTLVCQKQFFYGRQVVWVPLVQEIKKQS